LLLLRDLFTVLLERVAFDLALVLDVLGVTVDLGLLVVVRGRVTVDLLLLVVVRGLVLVDLDLEFTLALESLDPTSALFLLRVFVVAVLDLDRVVLT